MVDVELLGRDFASKSLLLLLFVTEVTHNCVYNWFKTWTSLRYQTSAGKCILNNESLQINSQWTKKLTLTVYSFTGKNINSNTNHKCTMQLMKRSNTHRLLTRKRNTYRKRCDNKFRDSISVRFSSGTISYQLSSSLHSSNFWNASETNGFFFRVVSHCTSRAWSIGKSSRSKLRFP